MTRSRGLLLSIALLVVFVAVAPAARAQLNAEGHTCFDAAVERLVAGLYQEIADLNQQIRYDEERLDRAEKDQTLTFYKVHRARVQLAFDKDRLRKAEARLRAFLALPPCTPMPHRFTLCEPCQGLVDQLNFLIDEYNAEQSADSRVRTPSLLEADLIGIGAKEKALDACLRRECPLLPSPYGVLNPTPGELPPPPAPNRPTPPRTQ